MIKPQKLQRNAMAGITKTKIKLEILFSRWEKSAGEYFCDYERYDNYILNKPKLPFSFPRQQKVEEYFFWNMSGTQCRFINKQLRGVFHGFIISFYG